ncbi:hypothetical protein LEP1GSC158_3400 [Leptospira interrogans serovar Zanoni str. LT2156]|uniref:Uncharacterized protein n=1 Tax=Leptospira interrogans serovar Zanoni str. LT2156 TaxID=1001601 RepID=M6HSD6_LEPIR|nr:hypothetical protein LEP1GSC158_3400 [Leptospira interrogans serovar Zanoni str. LT2156]
MYVITEALTYLCVPCRPTPEDQAKALSFLKDCLPERASFRDKGQGNY